MPIFIINQINQQQVPQIQVSSANIGTFSFKATFDLYNRTVLFDTSATTYNGGGASNVQGICFLLKDQDGVVLAAVDWGNPQIPDPSDEDTYTLDLSQLNFAFLYQQYEIVGYIKDQDGTIYSTVPVYKKVCEPVNVNESGYVPGMFQVVANCADNVLTVKDLTVYTYNGKQPDSVSKDGTLRYPAGTISPVTFSGTPFTNNVICSGENTINCTAVAVYDLQDDIFVTITYITAQRFPITCTNVLGDLSCCLVSLQNTAITNCSNPIGARARQQQSEVSFALMTGLLKQINGQDASNEVAFIKKTLNCDCGATSVRQNEMTPINPAVDSIVLIGAGGTTIADPTIIGDTKRFTIRSSSYSVTKGDTGDLAWTITVDTATTNQVKYKITFNYEVMAGYILDAIGDQDSGALKAQLNALVETTSNIDLTNLNGKCVIDLSTVNYFLSQLVPSSSATVKSILIGSTPHTAPTGLYVNNSTGIEAWLNGLGLGTYDASYSNGVNGAYINVLTVNNSHSPVSVTLTINGSDTTVLFQKTNKSLIALLQAMVDYLCGLTALQVALGQNLNLCQFDYSGNVIVNTLQLTQTQKDFNFMVSGAICNIAQRINTLTGVTCAKVIALFQAYPNAVFDNGSDFLLSYVAGNCTALSGKQVATAVIAAINAYSDVKSAFCAIDCTVPATCPDISSTSIAVSGTAIGIYGLTWATTPVAAQVVTVKYRVTGTLTWNIATQALTILPNGTISGNTPFAISPTTPGTTYDVQIVNNCGGVGFISQITMPTGSVYSGSFLRGDVIYTICSGVAVTLYSSAPFGPGVIMYTDIGLTTPLTGYTYVASATTGDIYDINTSTGLVGADTGLDCSSGIAGVYIKGNDTGTICAGSTVTLYTNGLFAVGGVLYSDSSLANPVTGFSYVVNTANNKIYNLNSSTGVIGADTGILCTATATLTFSFTNSGGSFLRFNALLSRSVDANVVVTRMFADGYAATDCSGSANSAAQSNGTNTISAGGTGFNIAPDSTTGTWNLANKSRMYNIIVNGASRLNGDVVVIGSYNVTIVIPSCA